MPIQEKVDPAKKRIVLVVHGVQAGDDAGLNQHELIKTMMINRLNGVQVDFDTAMYRYENINDKAYKNYQRLLSLFAGGIIAEKAVDIASDLALDVLINLKGGETARVIRAGLKEAILEYFEAGHPLYLVAHSLGTVYSFDVVNELMADKDLFARDKRKSWPVQGFVTLGSPLGLKMFKRNTVTDLGPGRKPFRWINYWDRTDPVVSGSLYGKPLQGYDVAERFTKGRDMGWFIQDRVVDIGQAWLLSHTGYWNHPPLGDDLADMVTH